MIRKWIGGMMRTLTVTDLGHWHHHDSAHDLELAVRDLLHWLHWDHGSLGGSLNLSVAVE